MIDSSIFIKRLLLFLFVITLAGGSFMFEFKIAGVDFYAFRIVLILGNIILLTKREFSFFNGKSSKFAFLFLLLWLFYAILSIAWSIDKIAAIRDIMYICYGILTFTLLVSVSKKNAFFFADLLRSWVMVFIVVIAFSIWEMMTATHLASNFTGRLKELIPFHPLNFTPVFTFDNPNHYAVFLCVTIVFFLYGILWGYHRVLLSFLTAVAACLVYLLCSRFGLILIGIYALLLLIYLARTGWIKNKLSALYMGAGIAVLLIAGIVPGNKFENINNVKAVEVIHDARDNLASDIVRRNLILNGVDFFMQSNGRGIGAGNYKSYIHAKKNRYPVENVTGPHNYFIELLAEYGIAIVILFLLLGAHLVFILIQSILRTKAFLSFHLFQICLLLCFALMSNANSIFVPLPSNWLMFSVLFINSDQLYVNLTEEHG